MTPFEWLLAGFAVIGSIISAVYLKYYQGNEDPMNDPINPPEAPIQPVQPSPPTVHALITFCEAIKTFEGANPANNNPGNCRCSPVGYLPKYGNVMCNPHNFAVFPTYELGWEYIQALVHYRAGLHPNWTILDFFNSYAPTSDNNPTLQYAEFVASRCGVVPTTTLKVLFG